MEPFHYIEKQKTEKKESSYCGKATKLVETYHHLIQPRPRENSLKHTSFWKTQNLPNVASEFYVKIIQS